MSSKGLEGHIYICTHRTSIHVLRLSSSMPATHLDCFASFDDMVMVVAADVLRPLQLWLQNER